MMTCVTCPSHELASAQCCHVRTLGCSKPTNHQITALMHCPLQNVLDNTTRGKIGAPILLLVLWAQAWALAVATCKVHPLFGHIKEQTKVPEQVLQPRSYSCAHHNIPSYCTWHPQCCRLHPHCSAGVATPTPAAVAQRL